MIGSLLGDRYELLEKIGEGGMAEVYKAKCHKLNRFVAVKILKKEFSQDAEFVKKFKREATAAASLSDDNIVDIYDVGSQGDINYIVLEYVKGKTLKEIIVQEGRLSSQKAVEIAMQIAKALDCAHKNNIIHRDIKPHNILVNEYGIVKVTDFGIAKASNSVTITNSSKVMGSAHYFSPEQAKGSYVDSKTDIYSLGVVIYEMVTGKVPFDGESPVSIALKHIQEIPIPPKKLNQNISEDLNSLILKALEKESIKRYKNAKDIIEDLKKIKHNEKLNINTNYLENDMTRIMDPIIVENKKDFLNSQNDDNNDDDDDDFEDFDYDEYDKKDKNKTLGKRKGLNKKKLISGIVSVLIIVIGAIAGFLAVNNTSAKEVQIPKIVGLNQSEARKKVEEKGLKFVVIENQKSDKPEGIVLKCYPEEGTKIKKNSDVRVIVSGGDKVTLPNVEGMNLKEAKDIIISSGFKVGNITYNNSDFVASNLVISQSPKPIKDVEKGLSIDLVVSSGPRKKDVAVPNVQGKSLEEGKSAIINAGLKIGNISSVDTNNKSLDGKIESQSIDASTTVKEGSSVNITYYKYKEPVNIPPKNPIEKPSDDNIGKPSEDESNIKNDPGSENNNKNSGDNNNTNGSKTNKNEKTSKN
ncbi:serine/threonine-protein kinase PrkC [Clostridium acetireducens DSM 10703]|jgi:serine/threonine protein kinase|uniref:non-specific serine/threonine protein kinase n=1 Tax=Clostridium acetireducens DSM 10703 TaxID=1121290 RepID=A0A1E8F219_9CLOT|nr:Stk1 family PASTA domain-containing Ser/Thr kinase [Clostridium acetireducens]OFI07674.1 serine/threonine-protein kinase PrkC [Clostridium acetireducens DSM 10703]